MAKKITLSIFAAKASSTATKTAAKTAPLAAKVTAKVNSTLGGQAKTVTSSIGKTTAKVAAKIQTPTAKVIAAVVKAVTPKTTKAAVKGSGGSSGGGGASVATIIQTSTNKAATSKTTKATTKAVTAAVVTAAVVTKATATKTKVTAPATVQAVKKEEEVDISEFFGYGWADFGAHGGGSIWDDILDWIQNFIIQPLLAWIADLINGLIILTSSFRRFSFSVWSFLGRLTDKFIDTVSAAWSNAWEMVVDTSKVIYDYIASKIFEIGQIIDAKIEEAKGWIEDVKAEVKEWFMTAYHILTDPYINIWLWLKNNWPGVYNLLSDPVEFIKIALENFKYLITAIIFTPLLELIDNLWGD